MARKPYRAWLEETEEPVERLLTALRDCEAEEFGGVDVAELEDMYLTVQNWLAENHQQLTNLIEMYASGFHIGGTSHTRAEGARKAQDMMLLGMGRWNPPPAIQYLVDLQRRLLKERLEGRAFSAVSMLGLLLAQGSVAGLWPQLPGAPRDHVQEICDMPV